MSGPCSFPLDPAHNPAHATQHRESGEKTDASSPGNAGRAHGKVSGEGTHHEQHNRGEASNADHRASFLALGPLQRAENNSKLLGPILAQSSGTAIALRLSARWVVS